MESYKKFACIFMILSSVLFCCKQEEQVTMPNKNKHQVDYKALTGEKVFFGHQSVGQNILTGVRRAAPSLSMVEMTGMSDIGMTDANIMHLKIGRNGAPESKIDDFKKALIDGNIGARVSVAAMKLCYVDFNKTTDVKALFANYVSAMETIKQRFPNLTIVHITAPLTVHEPRSLKERIKRLFKSDIANVKRNEYNAMLCAAFQGKEALFNLAESECVSPDGKRWVFTYKGKRYDALYPGYSSDGGHLNEVGQTVAANEFLYVIGSNGRKP